MYPHKANLAVFLSLFFTLTITTASAQDIEPDSKPKIYKVNRYWATGIGVVGTTTNILGLDRLLNKKDPTPEETILALNKDDVNSFDRWALNRDFSKVDNAQRISDYGLYGSFFLPATLFIDKEIRKDWLDISLMYFETQAIAANIYSWSPLGPTFIKRYRPSAYYDENPIEERVLGKKRNSFFSGHVSTTACGAFFTAKVYCDYHPDLGAKKFLIYGLALIPTSVVAVNRIRSLNHFPTDTIMGTAVGAAAGILIPQWHKNRSRKLGLSVIYNEDVKLVVTQWQF